MHARQVARWLLGRTDVKLSVNALPWGDTAWLLDRTSHDGLIGALMDRTSVPSDLRGTDSMSVQLQLPNEWDPNVADVNVGMSAVVETDRCSPEWVAACNKMTRVIVPSKHAEACLRASGTITTPIVVVPEAYGDAFVPGVPQATLPELDAPTNVLLFGQLTGANPHSDRKNLFFAVKWLCELLRDRADVGIVLKTNMGRNTLIDRDIVVNMMKGLLTEVRRGPNPRLTLLHGDMSDAEVSALYRHPQIAMLAAPTRGEGFGLPILEAAAAGLPVVATGWSGHMDFLQGHGIGHVDYKLVDVHPSRVDGKIFLKGARWAEPNEVDFKQRITRVLNESAVHRAEAAQLAQVVQRSHSFAAVAKSYDAALGDLL